MTTLSRGRLEPGLGERPSLPSVVPLAEAAEGAVGGSQGATDEHRGPVDPGGGLTPGASHGSGISVGWPDSSFPLVDDVSATVSARPAGLPDSLSPPLEGEAVFNW